MHEVKFDGFRIGAAVEHGRATLLSRRSKDWTAELASVAAGAARLGAKSALLDGEVAAVRPDGRTSMGGMHEGSTIAYFVFDLLHLDGEDLTGRPIAWARSGSAPTWRTVAWSSPGRSAPASSASRQAC